MRTESVRTAIGELKKESLSFNGKVALAVIEVYINQQEKPKYDYKRIHRGAEE